MLLTLSKTALLRFFSVIAALVAALGSGPAIAQTQDIVIGQVAPLSGQIYFDYINAKGGIKGRLLAHKTCSER